MLDNELTQEPKMRDIFITRFIPLSFNVLSLALWDFSSLLCEK
ncbi:hypothetical protein [Helicobacter canadensis]|nr:hypothetical protein [Helicobacter canadensis]EFR49082.1 hypothetical protein HCMG_01255 [Helicobacter canadensis MIT 98-5491]